MKIEDYVNFFEPVIQYKGGEPFVQQKKVRARIIEIKANGDLKLKRQDGGYSNKAQADVILCN
jgi:hypothetical protein